MNNYLITIVVSSKKGGMYRRILCTLYNYVYILSTQEIRSLQVNNVWEKSSTPCNPALKELTF